MSITKYQVSGMTCGGCVNRVKTTLHAFAEHVEVTLEPPQVVLTAPSADLNALNNALKLVGNYQLSVKADALKANSSAPSEASFLTTYKPLLLVFAYILLVTFAIEITQGEFDLHRWMPNFMAGFFLVFSFFKLLDLRGFAQSYAMYDILAKRVPAYGFVYPFIELGLGAAYLLGYRPADVNLITLIVMGFSSLGVILAVKNKQKIRCACLGTGFNLPMTTVTIIEDLLMVAMSAYMLLWHLN
jgi:copper chaperone CopZ